MIRVSKPSMGPDWYWSSPLPCGTPSTTSIITTVRARDFSASRWAAVAPTFPAPTTATFLSIPAVSSLGGWPSTPMDKAPENIALAAPRAHPRGSERLVQHDPHRGRQVEAAHRPRHRNGEAALGVLLQDPGRHPLRLAAEDETAVVPVRCLPVAQLRPGREVQAAAPVHRVPESEPVGVDPHIHAVPVVEPGAFELGIAEGEAE